MIFRTVKKFLFYSIPYFISIILPILSLPILTRYLTLKDFGYIALFELCLLPAYVITQFGADYIVKAYWHKSNTDKRKLLISTLLIYSTILSSISILLLTLFSKNIFHIITGDESKFMHRMIYLMHLSIIANIPKMIFNAWVIIEERLRLYTTINLLKTITNTMGVIYVAFISSDYVLIITWIVLINLIFGIIKFILLAKNSTFKFDIKFLIDLIKLGGPIQIESAFNTFVKQIDSILISRFFGPLDYAIYNFTTKLYNSYCEIFEHYRNSFDPQFFKELSRNEGKDLNSFKEIFLLWSYLVIILSLIFSIFGKTALEIISNKIFIQSYEYLVAYSCVIVLNLIFFGNEQVIIFSRNTKYILKSSISKGIITILMALITVPNYGLIFGIISIWFGNLVYYLLINYKKKELINKNFIENKMLFIAFVFHLIIAIRIIQPENFLNDYLSFVFIIYIISKSYKKIINKKSQLIFFR